MNQSNACTDSKTLRFFFSLLLNLLIETNEEQGLLLKAAVDFVFQPW